MRSVRAFFLIATMALVLGLLAAPAALAITSEQIASIPLRDDLQRNDPPPTFSSSGLGAGKWSTPTAFGASAESRGGSYNTGGRLGYGSPGAWAAAYWNANVFEDAGSGVAAKATLTTPLKSGETVAIWLNMPSPTSKLTGYALVFAGSAGGYVGTAYLYKWVNASPQILATSPAVTQPGTIYALAEKNGEISAWGSVGGGSAFVNPEPFRVIDGSPLKAGYAGLQMNGGGATLDDFSAGSLPPLKPTLSSTAPTSPAQSNSPTILGSAEAGTTVRLYTNSSCSGSPIATGSAASFTSTGIPVSVGNGSTTTFYATAANIEGVASPCSSTSVTYTQDSVSPPTPTFTWTAPVSPGASTAPRLAGSAENGSTVRLYKTANCTGTAVGSGSATAFASPGITVSVAKDSSLTVYATATDSAGNASPCSSTSLTYANKASQILFEGSNLADFALIQACTTERVSEVPDPLGSGKTVLKFTVYDSDVPNHGCSGVTPTNNPRATAISPSFIESGSELWLRCRFMIPNGFPEISQWMTLVSVYGPPENGTSPWRTEVTSIDESPNFTFQRNATYNWDIPWATAWTRGKWVEVLLHERFSPTGFIEEWWNGSQLTFFNPESSPWNPSGLGATNKLEMQTVDSTNNKGPNSVRIGQYRAAGMFEVGSVYYEFVKVGTTRESVGS